MWLKNSNQIISSCIFCFWTTQIAAINEKCQNKWMHWCHSSCLKNHLQQPWVILSNSLTPEDDCECGSKTLSLFHPHSQLQLKSVIIIWKKALTIILCFDVFELELWVCFPAVPTQRQNTAHKLLSREALVLSKRPEQQKCYISFGPARANTCHIFNINLGESWPDTHNSSCLTVKQHFLSRMVYAELHFQQQLLPKANSQSQLVFVYPCINHRHSTDWAPDHNCVPPLVLWVISAGLFNGVELSCHKAELFSYILIWGFLLSISIVGLRPMQHWKLSIPGWMSFSLCLSWSDPQ